MRICWIIRDLGHYHAARMATLAAGGRGELRVIELTKRSEFSEFAATREALTTLRARTLFGPDAAAVAVGRLRRALYQALDEARPDVVFVNGWSHSSAILAMAWSRAHRRPFVMVSDSTAVDHSRVAWREAIKRLLVGRASAAFVAGTRHAQYVCALGMPETSVFDGYDAVDNDHFAAGADAARRDERRARSALKLPERYLLGVARFIPRKGLAMLIEAFARYRCGAATANLELLLVGDGPQRADLEQLAQALGVGAWVHFRGFQGYGVLPAYYGLAQALIVPSCSEPWGLVVNEAMASALPVLVSSACGCADDLVVHGHNGFVLDPTDVNGLMAHLRFIDEQPRRTREMGLNARSHIGAWGLAHFAAHCWQAAQAALACGPSRPVALEVQALEAFAYTRPGLP